MANKWWILLFLLIFTTLPTGCVKTRKTQRTAIINAKAASYLLPPPLTLSPNTISHPFCPLLAKFTVMPSNQTLYPLKKDLKLIESSEMLYARNIQANPRWSKTALCHPVGKTGGLWRPLKQCRNSKVIVPLENHGFYLPGLLPAHNAQIL